MMADGLRNPLCVALDSSDRDSILEMAQVVAADVGLLKLGLTALHGAGTDVVADLSQLAPVFVDAKLHDIPAQVAGALEAIADSGAWCATVHASGGPEMVAAAVEAAGGTKVIAVTILTSLDDVALRTMGVEGSVSETVVKLASSALEAGADGLVCSAHEVAALRDKFRKREDGGPLLVVPGIRPRGDSADDQKRFATPGEAVASGADILVVGRPVTGAAHPEQAARSILAETAP